MTKLYLDLSYVSSVPEAYKVDSIAMMQFMGANAGNYAFRHALKSLVVDFEKYKPITNGDINSELTYGQPEKVIISCANWLSESDQYENSNGIRSTLFDKFQCPITCLGLGAQASSDNASVSFGPNTIRLAHILADKCQSLSVRDQYTAEILANLGIKNTVITGCPSNFINLDQQLGKKVVEKAEKFIDEREWADIRTHIAEFSGGHAMSKKVLKATLELLNVSSAFYVIQSPDLFPFLFGETNKVHPLYLGNTPFEPGDTQRLRILLKEKLMHFSSIEAWMDFARTCNLSIGMRIHGNMVPLQAGVPAIVISHDSRTSGLTQTMGIPSIEPAQFIAISKTRPSAIFKLIIEKMGGYDSTRKKLANTMATFLEENGIKATASLHSFNC